MASRFTELVFDCHDPEGLARFWCAVLDFKVIDRSSTEDEATRLLALGATKVDVGQGHGRSWVVMADPEGNEFDVVRTLAPQGTCRP
ncbi:VOC family protein [Streptomyces sp. NPDC001661]